MVSYFLFLESCGNFPFMVCVILFEIFSLKKLLWSLDFLKIFLIKNVFIKIFSWILGTQKVLLIINYELNCTYHHHNKINSFIVKSRFIVSRSCFIHKQFQILNLTQRVLHCTKGEQIDITVTFPLILMMIFKIYCDLYIPHIFINIIILLLRQWQ